MIKQQLANNILTILTNSFPGNDFSELKIIFQVPKDNKNGDLSTNIAMQLKKQLQKESLEIAEIIIAGFSQNNLVNDVQVAGAGFLNFFLKQEDVFLHIDKMIQEDASFGQQLATNQSINVEYVSVNPTGDLHIGHARGAVYGDVICNILKKVGHNVTKEYYINDAGSQIQKLGLSVWTRYRQLMNEDIPMIEDGYHGEDIITIAQQLVDNEQTKINQFTTDEEKLQFFSEYALTAELAKIREDLQLLNIKHDVWFSERSLYNDDVIKETLKKLTERNMTYELDGALWLKSTNFSDDKDRVLIKSDGSYTYFTPDIAYHVNKISRLQHESKQLIDILGGDHHGYVARMKAALQAFGYSEDILNVELIQMVRFIKDGQEVKMSKRTGNSITMRELIEEIGADAVRYFFSMRSCDTPLDFDMNLAKEESNNNPIFYAQYAHARICSIIRKSEDVLDISSLKFDNDYKMLNNEKELELAKKLNQYVDVINLAAKRLEPFKITNYIQELAATFHAFYNAVKVLDETNVELSSQRIKLLLATRAVLRSAFAIIGINAPEKM
jgi:arginyl-tRNA synthetase